MTETTRQVLEMLASGKITTDEADRLIAALREPGTPASTTEGADRSARPRYLRVMVDANEDDGPTRVNIRVPIQFLRAGVRLASLVPQRAQSRINDALREQGVDVDITRLKPEDVDELIDALRDTSVDIASAQDVKIRIFSE